MTSEVQKLFKAAAPVPWFGLRLMRLMVLSVKRKRGPYALNSSTPGHQSRKHTTCENKEQ